MAYPEVVVALGDEDANQTGIAANPLHVQGTTDMSDRIGRLLGKITNYDVLANGTLGALNATLEIAAAGLGTMGVGITGTWVGTIAIQGDVGDGVWQFLPMIDALTGTAIVTTTANGIWQIGCAGFLTIRVLMFAYTSGTATVYIEGTSATAGVFLSKSIPTGINSIGTVGVTSVPGALQGPGNPTVDSYTSVAVNLAASTADQQLVAAPGANKQIWVYGLFMMADTAAGTVTLQDEDNTALSGTMAVSDEGGWVLPISGNFAMPWIKVATNKALECDTGACTIDGILCYGIISV
jgi:hypothetical protein